MKRSTTELGKYLKKLRIDRSETLSDMAEKLKVSSSFLSAVEVGKRNIPDTMVEKIETTYDFSDTQRQEFFEACSVTSNTVELKLNSVDGNGGKKALDEVEKARNDVALSFGWKFLDLSPEQINKIKDILEEGENSEE